MARAIDTRQIERAVKNLQRAGFTVDKAEPNKAGDAVTFKVSAEFEVVPE
ncbi:hypothetical protein WJT74_07685 [Sphingomicrobium sp. XHP0239]